MLDNKLKIWRRFVRDEGGQFAVIAALVGVPLVLAAGLALDSTNSKRYKNNLKSTLDTAALAAVLPANLTDTAREEYAEFVFNENYIGNANMPVTLDISATRDRVDITANAEIPTLFGGILGHSSFDISGQSIAELTRSDVVCVLALDPSGENSIEFLDDARYNSPACSVQANSNHVKAINSEILAPPVASSFCSGGGSEGEYAPMIKHNCSPVEDPYADLQIPAAGKSCDSSRQVVIQGGNTTANGAFLESELEKDADGNSIIPDYSTLSPGIYCRGMKINGANVYLQPGVYHVWGNLEFTQNASVYGDGVTFILKGTDNRLLINDGAEVSLRAPSTGLTQGLVFWQKYLEFVPYLWGKIPDSPDRVIATSEISSGGGLKIIGTAYLPDHELVITSENSVASQSPATSFIARRIKFAGNANMQVRVDHQAGGIPPMLPRSDDGARLVK